MKNLDLTTGVDKRGNNTFFIAEKHIIGKGWELDDKTIVALPHMGVISFRLIDEDGEETSAHGYIDGGEIVQWG